MTAELEYADIYPIMTTMIFAYIITTLRPYLSAKYPLIIAPTSYPPKYAWVINIFSASLIPNSISMIGTTTGVVISYNPTTIATQRVDIVLSSEYLPYFILCSMIWS